MEVEILAVVVGGLLTVAGGFAVHFAADRSTAKREAATLLRERIERFVKALRENSHWLEAKQNALLWHGESHDVPPPIGEASMIQMLYFPELADEMKAVLAAQGALVTYLYGQRIQQVKDMDAWQKSWDSAVVTELFREHLEADRAAVEKCREILQARTKD